MPQKDIRPAPAEIQYKGFKFLITDRPSDQNILIYIQIPNNFVLKAVRYNHLLSKLLETLSVLQWKLLDQELKKHNVSAVVRVCEPSYKTDDLNSIGIEVIDLVYDDGTFPPIEVVDEWFKLLKNQLHENPDACVAVHCVSGLGRAPVLVALALIELGLKYEEAVELIREKRRGAINAKQLGFLEKYRPKSRLKLKNGHKNSCCVQ